MSLSSTVQRSLEPVVLTVTLNPMLDKTIHVDRLVPGTIMRAVSMKAIAGGKGVNVSRVLHSLGVDTVATGFLGGRVGDEVLDRLAFEGIPSDFVRIRDTTREGFTFVDASTGESTAVFEPAHRVEAIEARRLLQKFGWLSARSTWVCLSGSIPCAGLEELYADLILQAKATGTPAILDSYDIAFARGVEAAPFMVKPNRHELERTFGGRLPHEAAVFELADRFHSSGVQWVVVSDGARAALISVNGEHWRASPPSVASVNPVGSGDAMVAGFVYSFVQGLNVEDSIRHGVAAGAANARVWDAGSCTRQDLDELVPQVNLKRL